MTQVRAQYEAFPYPERDPRDEQKRLITGSPSLPAEMDHCLWGGRRDWSKPLRVLFAGGGSGDGLVQLAQTLTSANRPYEITYVDLSTASRKIAEDRVKIRNLDNITFVTGSLLDAADLGAFDYIDCCGVLHHLPDPLAGLTALKSALAPNGGLGFMVYAPLGRSGVYPLQAAFNRLYGHLPPRSMLKHAKKAFGSVSKGHPLRRNPHLSDHEQSDAGFYDLLLHSQDRAYDVTSWMDALEKTGWSLASFIHPGFYDLERLVDTPGELTPIERMAIAEQLRGTIKTHVGYARTSGDAVPEFDVMDLRVPHLMNTPATVMARAIQNGDLKTLSFGSEQIGVNIQKTAAPLVAQIDGRRSVGEIAKVAGMALDKALRLWGHVDAALTPWGMLRYSRFLL